MSRYNPEDYEIYVLVATSNQNGATAVREIITGRKNVAERAQGLIESDHSVKIFDCVEKNFEVVMAATLHFYD